MKIRMISDVLKEQYGEKFCNDLISMWMDFSGTGCRRRCAEKQYNVNFQK